MEYGAELGRQAAQTKAKRREYSKWENQEVEIVEESTHYTSFISGCVMADKRSTEAGTEGSKWGLQEGLLSHL